MKSDLITAAFYAPITKVEKTPEGHRIVTGVLQSESVDVDGQIADYDWFKKQAQGWFEKYANVREMHDRKAVGKGIQIEFDDVNRRTTLVSKVVDPGAVVKIDEKILGFYSFGAKNDPANPVQIIKDASAPKGRIVGGTLVEASLVDRPANADCVLTIAKMAGAGLEVTDVIEKAPSPDDGETDTHVHEHSHDSGSDHEYAHSHPHGHDGGLHADGEEADHTHAHAHDQDGDDKAAVADLAKRDFSDKKRDQMADEGTALPDGSFPIANKGDLENAVKAYGRAKDKSAAKAHIIKRAKALDATDMLPEGWLQKTPEPDLTKDAAVPVLEGDEAAHNGPLNDALSAIKTLINQELAEDETEFDCVNWLSGIAQSLLAWANSEQAEGMDDDDDDGAFFAAFADLTKAAAEPDIAKRRVFYSREHRTAVEQALRNLTQLVSGDMQGPTGADTSAEDAPDTEGTDDGQAAQIADQDELHADGDARVREPAGVEQAGPSKGAETDIDKAAEADLEKFATPDFVKAAIESALEELRPKLEEELLEKFASAEALAGVKETVDQLAGGPHPTGPRVGQVVEKVAAINQTVEDSGPPLEIIQRMAELEKAATNTSSAETRAAYEGYLRRLRDQYLTTTA